MYELSSKGINCVSTPTVEIPEFAQLESGKSIILYFPPKGTAGLAISFVNTCNLVPCPPASSIATTSFFRAIKLTPFFKTCLFLFYIHCRIRRNI